ncbi:MAG: hypothetical protein OEZ36_08235 [Spirochaetota bacterium]|nr:hypothetical protein [Spirochaetota bacterium]
MKRVIGLLFILLFLVVYSHGTESNPYFRFSATSKVEQYPHGVINWTSGYFLGRANEKALSPSSKLRLKELLKTASGRLELQQELIEEAKKNLLNIILKTKVDSYGLVKDYFKKNNSFKLLFLEELEKNIIILPPIFSGAGKMDAVVKFPIFGRNSLSDLIYRLDDNVEAPPKNVEGDRPLQERTYTSIIIDLRKTYKFIQNVSVNLDLANLTPELTNLLYNNRFPSKVRRRVFFHPEKNKLYYKGIMTLDDKETLEKISGSIRFKRLVEELFDSARGRYMNTKREISLEGMSPDLKNVIIKNRFPRVLRRKIRFMARYKNKQHVNEITYRGTMSIKEKELLINLTKHKDNLYEEMIDELFERSKNSEKVIRHSPAIFPRIYDSHNRLIYSKDMVPLTLRNKMPYSKYTTDKSLLYKIEKVGENPLLILADKVKGENNCDIVINREDARLLFLHKRTIDNLMKGRIYFLVQ